MKQEFPILQTSYTYLDTAASSQKPQTVLDTLNTFYTTAYSNVHRGLHEWAEYSTIQYENARKIIAEHLGTTPENIIFTNGTTQSMNLLANTLPITKNSVVITSILDHHSTFVPFQQRAKKEGAAFKTIPLTKEGTLDYEQAEHIIAEGVTVLAITQLSNVTGETIDVARLAKAVHKAGGTIVVDGAQGFAHLRTNVEELGIDAYACSGHKSYGPTGIGALYIKTPLMNTLPPYVLGGEMISNVTKEETTFREGRERFEAGTPPIAQAAGMAAAVRWMQTHTSEQEEDATKYCVEQLLQIPEVTIIGPEERTGAVTFTVKEIHAHDVAQFLGAHNIAVRAGHHCCQPLHDNLGIPASVRASFGRYNDRKDVNRFIAALNKCLEAFDV